MLLLVGLFFLVGRVYATLSHSQASCFAKILPHEISSVSGTTFESWTADYLHCHKIVSDAEEALANATYASTMNTTGWDEFRAAVPPDRFEEQPIESAASVGYLEGSLGAQRISDFLYNTLVDQGLMEAGASAVNMSIAEELFAYEAAQEIWVAVQIAYHATLDGSRGSVGATDAEALWSVVAALYAQVAGIANGLNASGVKLYGLSAWRAAITVNMVGDGEDLLTALAAPKDRPQWHSMDPLEYAMRRLRHEHCSAFVSLGTYNDELYVGHNMWWGFAGLMPVFKTVTWGSRGSVQMTSFPGAISSMDDFYSMASPRQQLVVMETTNTVYRNELWDLITPESLWTWTRAMAANFLAETGRDWVSIFSKHNSGTYNNMWIVVDYKRFTPYGPVLPDSGLLWVLEQMPGKTWQSDESERLARGGILASYNEAYFPSTHVYSGALANDYYWKQTFSITSFNYQLATRAILFRAYAHLAGSLSGAQQLLRWNKFATDPVVVGSPDLLAISVPEVYGSLAARGDLVPSDRNGPFDSVATNAALVSRALVQQGKVLAVAGPTHDSDECPVFNWSTAPPAIQNVPHKGAPDTWDFDWGTFDV